MPQYYFNIRDGSTDEDATGSHFPDVYRAQTEAVRFAGEVISELGAQFWEGPLQWSLEVADESGAIIFVLRFSCEERFSR